MVMAHIYRGCGRYDEALDELENVLSLELGLTVNDLEFGPWTKPLRNNPRFQAMIERYALTESL
jgi:hypothetical protein